MKVKTQNSAKMLQRVCLPVLLICFLISTISAQSDFFKNQDLNTSDKYLIVAKHSRKVFDVTSVNNNTPIIQYSKHGGVNQQFQLVSKGNGYYTIRSVKHGKVLDIQASSKADGGKLVLFDSGSGANQQFKLIDNGDGYCKIQAKHSGKYLDVTGSSTNNSAEVVQYLKTKNPNQLFKFVKQKDSYTQDNFFIPASEIATAKFKSPCGVATTSFGYPTAPSSYNNTQKGYYSLDFYVTVNKEAPDMYWAQQFWFGGGDGGYLGIQSSGQYPNEPDTKIAIFSIWKAKNAEASSGGVAKPFDHEGSGYSCKIKYNWKEGRTYRIRLHQISDAKKPQNDEWWGAWIMDMTTSQEKQIGKILIPGSWNWLKSRSSNFTEYFGQQTGRSMSCDQIPYSKATFSFPKMDGGAIKPQKSAYKTYGDCKSAAIIELINSTTYKVETGLNK